MKVSWISRGISRDKSGKLDSILASNRYRVIIPSSILIKNGIQVEILDADQWISDPSHLADVIIISKIHVLNDYERFLKFSAELISRIMSAKDLNIPIIADFNDNHFEHPFLGSLWQKTAAIADLCVAASPEMAKILQKYNKRPAVVVSDPIEYIGYTALDQEKEGKISKPQPISQFKLAWYGNLNNWTSLSNWALKIAQSNWEVGATIDATTTLDVSIKGWVEKYNSIFAPKRSIALHPWSKDTQINIIKNSDIVLIPGNHQDHKALTKTPNRLIEALNYAKPVIASPLASYREFSDFVHLTDNPELVALESPLEIESLRAKAKQGQSFVKQNYSQEVISNKWKEAIGVAIREKRA